MKFILLTHEAELQKKTNTGALVRAALGDDCELIIWRRKQPDPALLALLESRQAVLLFPDSQLTQQGGPQRELPQAERNSLEEERCGEGRDVTHFVILDATWQQAKKMYRQSPYLQSADKVSLPNPPPSQFLRRRNQREGCLCTAECAIELLRQVGHYTCADSLERKFEVFNTPPARSELSAS